MVGPLAPKPLHLITYLVCEDRSTGLLWFERTSIDTYETTPGILHIITSRIMWKRPKPPTHWVFASYGGDPHEIWPHQMTQFPIDNK